MVAKPRTENMQRMARERSRIPQKMAMGGGGRVPQERPPAEIKFIRGEWRQLEFSFAVEGSEEEKRVEH